MAGWIVCSAALLLLLCIQSRQLWRAIHNGDAALRAANIWRDQYDTELNRRQVAVSALRNAAAGAGHAPTGWCAHCYANAWAGRVESGEADK